MVVNGKNPYRPDCVQVQCVDADGNQYWHVLAPVAFDEHGFRESAAVIGQEYKAYAKSEFEQNRDKVQQIAYDANSEDEVKAAKKANKPLFGGRIDPYKHITDTTLPEFIPKRGQEHELTTNAKLVELKPLSVIDAAKRFKVRFGEAWGADNFQWLNKHYADGIQETELETLLARNEPPGTRHLYVVNS